MQEEKLHYAISVKQVCSIDPQMEALLGVVGVLTGEPFESSIVHVTAIYQKETKEPDKHFKIACDLWNWDEQEHEKKLKCQLNIYNNKSLCVVFFWIRPEMLNKYYFFHRSANFLLAPSQIEEKKKIEEENNTMLGLMND